MTPANGGGAGGLELPQQRGELDAHCVLHHRKLVRILGSEDGAQAFDIGVKAAFAAGLDQQAA